VGRRSDHSREELTALFLRHGHAHLAEVGFRHFSAREVAKRVGYSIGTLYNVWGTVDRLLAAINSHTFTLWAGDLRVRLDAAGEGRIAALVAGYFAFARNHTNLWTAIYDHRLPPDVELSPQDQAERAVLTDIVVAEVARALAMAPEDARPLARSLIATVHGHCSLELTGAFALMGEPDAQGVALTRVREALIVALTGTGAGMPLGR
jgi:AcrR family transcriptional regulator